MILCLWAAITAGDGSPSEDTTLCFVFLGVIF